MKIKNIKIENFRLLKEISIDLENKLSLVLGKNNTGKTSFLTILEKFLGNGNNFSFDDFNLEFQKQIESIVSKNLSKNDFEEHSIRLKLYIEYDEDDNLDKVSSLIMNLDPDDNILIISFEYVLEFEKYIKLISDFNKFKEGIEGKDVLYFLKKNHSFYFRIKKLALESGNESSSIEVDDKDIRRVINFQAISAKRGVANQDASKTSDKTLSKLSSSYYDNIEKPDITEITELERKLIDSDIALTDSYKEIFKPVLKNIKKFGAVNQETLELEIKSTLEEKNILKENTQVTYNHQGHILPEDYNGLGYMNLFAILFTIHIKVDSFKRIKDDAEPSAINLLFIEEPEAHTHPQMQYVFIKNIKNMLDEETGNGKNLSLQTIITTHSSHIASQSDFNDIKYFLKTNSSVISKNLSELEKQYGSGDDEKRNFQFLKQYLTLNRAELFFTDKVVFIEGDTERILLPAMMKKMDDENKGQDDYTPLLSQHISIVEAGAYSKVFDKLMDFLEIQVLIITDLDSVKCTQIIKDGKPQENEDGTPKMSKPKAVRVAEAEDSSNISIKYFLAGATFNDLKSLGHKQKVIKNGKACIAFQTCQNGYHARSFEDSFIHLNREFVKQNKEVFTSVKNRSLLGDGSKDAYELAENCIDKKTLFATDILYYGGENLENWETPEYIKEGLLWLSHK